MILSRYQPIVDSFTRRRIGYEATMRGKNGETAQQLIEAAESEGTLHHLDLAAFRRSVNAAVDVLDPDELLFVNVSTVETLKWLTSYDLPRAMDRKIVIEITEHLHLTDQLARLIRSLTDSGYQIAIDDFGKGSSNWRSLIELDVAFVKLDMFFVTELNNPTTASVIRSMSSLCRDNDIKLIVEGVETKEQYINLLELGARYMQGYFFGFPASAAGVMRRKQKPARSL